MMPGQVSMILRQIDVTFNGGTVVGLTDRQLVERFAAQRDPSAEVAFAALVRRHGAMKSCCASVGPSFVTITTPRMLSRRPSWFWHARLGRSGWGIRWDPGSTASHAASRPPPKRP